MGGIDEVDEFLEQEFITAPKVLTSDLYHYTSSEAAILGILASRTIRLSPFRGTNDLWESRPHRPNLEGELSGTDFTTEDYFSIWEDVDRYIRGYSKVACFTQDWELPDSVVQPDALRGWAHLSLWAHYGGGHTGVCLRFDREQLLASFEAAQRNAIHQFCGPVRYRRAEFGVGPHGVSLEQAEEFGIDAVAIRYARVNSDRVFFRKHADWSSESEYRLVRTDLSTEPHYFDITKALTGVVLGEAFPRDRIPALLAMLSGFGDVEVLQAGFHNRSLQLFPMEPLVEPEAVPTPIPVTLSRILPRRSGDLAQRVSLLEEAERIADSDRETATQAVALVLQAWRQGLADHPGVYADWPGVVFSQYPRIVAIPPEERGGRPGVPGDVIAHEAGLMVVGEHQSKRNFTWVMAIAVQLLPGGAGRLHACITVEEPRGGNIVRKELYRDRREADPDELLEASSEVLARMIEAIPEARSHFDELRGERMES